MAPDTRSREVRSAIMVTVLITAMCVLLLVGPAVVRAEPLVQVAEGHGKPKPKSKDKDKGGHGEKKPEGSPEGEAKHEAKKPEKPKPKKPDKTKNCQWDEDINVEIDNKYLKLTQMSLKNVMRGGESEQNGYNVYADTDKLVLKIRAPDGNWYLANMTRLGDLDEGCVFYMVGEPRQVDGEPPLY